MGAQTGDIDIFSYDIKPKGVVSAKSPLSIQTIPNHRNGTSAFVVRLKPLLINDGVSDLL
jgi:hypothetical protein